MTRQAHQLEGSTVLVTGASGEVGWGIAHQAIADGAHAILPTRSEQSSETLRAEFGDNATIVVTDISTQGGIDDLLSVVDARGPLHHVVAPIGSYWNKGLTLERSPDELSELLDTYAVTQLRLAQATIPRLEPTGGSYTLITGAAGEHTVDGTGLLTVAVTAQFGLARVLIHELRDSPARFNEVRIAARIERSPRPGVIDSRTAGGFFTTILTGAQRNQTIRLTPDMV
jgi:NAD(P)-dependent dehydrogenase (short-subunit alcohol dehydrogenase family)